MYTWQAKPAAQQPDWSLDSLAGVVGTLANFPPLVAASECDQLRGELAAVAQGEAILLQAGDCVETFRSVTPDSITRKVHTISTMARLLADHAGLPVVTVGRIAGQYAKPQPPPSETQNGISVPPYLGDAVNSLELAASSRAPDPRRLLRAYNRSAATLAWMRELTATTSGHHNVRPMAGQSGNIFVSHEALLLAYESALVRIDSATGLPFASSAHLIWLGDHTRQLDGAHVDFAARMRNPIGVKIGPAASPEDVLSLAETLDPQETPGRLTLITRMGSGAIRAVLPRLVERVARAGRQVIWACDPMHGNTVTASSGLKTRRFDDVVDEFSGFLEVHHALGTHPGGLHLEITGEDVTECLGGPQQIDEVALSERYETACDPRLNHTQAIHLASQAGQMMSSRTGYQLANAS